jgi:hypothetical protein
MTNGDDLKQLALKALEEARKKFKGLPDEVLHCANCGCADFFQLHEHGTWIEVCVDCGRRVFGAA